MPLAAVAIEKPWHFKLRRSKPSKCLLSSTTSIFLRIHRQGQQPNRTDKKQQKECRLEFEHRISLPVLLTTVGRSPNVTDSLTRRSPRRCYLIGLFQRLTERF